MVPNTSGGTIVAGGYFDINNQPIIDRSVPGKERQFFSDCPDGTSLITTRQSDGEGHQGQRRVRRRAVRIRDARSERESACTASLPSPIAVLTLDQDPATGKLTLVSYHERRYIEGAWFVDHLRREPVAVEHASVERRVRAGRRDDLIDRCAVQGLQHATSTATKRRRNPYHYGHLPEVTVQSRRHRHDQEALLPRPHLARTGSGDAGQAHRADGRRRHQRRPLHVRRRQARPICRRARCTSRSATQASSSGRGRGHALVDQPRPRDQRRDRGARQHADARRHHGRRDAKDRRLDASLHEDQLQRHVQLGSRQAGHGRRRRRSSRRIATRRCAAAAWASRSSKARRSTSKDKVRLFGDVAHREVDGEGRRGIRRTSPSTRPSTPARSTRST